MHSVDFEDQLVELIEWRNEHHFGKYRGIVDSVEEGDDLGFIAVKVPELFGRDHLVEHVRACSPFAGNKHGLVVIPEPGDAVWVEFEAGKPSLPIWTGFWWADGHLPEPKGKLVRSFITTKGHKLLLDDDADEVKLIHSAGPSLVMTGDDVTITIGNASIKLTSSDITLQVGAAATAPQIKIESSQITIKASTIGSAKLTSSGVEIANGALKVGG